MNLKAASNGRIYAVVKTSKNRRAALIECSHASRVGWTPYLVANGPVAAPARSSSSSEPAVSPRLQDRSVEQRLRRGDRQRQSGGSI
jgi:hypothetical protein